MKKILLRTLLGIGIFYFGFLVFALFLPSDKTQIEQGVKTSPTVKVTNATKVNPTDKPKPTAIPSPTPNNEDLDFEVRHNEYGLRIVNNESKDRKSCRLELNGGILRGGYKYTQDLFAVGEPVIILYSEFAKDDGTRFDSLETKALNLTISCGGLEDRGFGYYEVK